MPGSTDNPVKFANPFQRIVGVHWPDSEPQTPPTAFAFSVRYGAVTTGETTVAPIYWSPFGTPDLGLYHPTVFVPKTYGAWAYYEGEGWISALSPEITGMADFGASPYAQGSSVPLSSSSGIALEMEWAEPVGGDLGFVTAISADEGAPRSFLAGAASIVGRDGGPTSLIFPTDITAELGTHHFAYAGATTLRRIIANPENLLVGDRELHVLCLPVTA